MKSALGNTSTMRILTHFKRPAACPPSSTLCCYRLRDFAAMGPAGIFGKTPAVAIHRLLLALAAVSSTSAVAENGKSVSAAITLTSDYRFRGISQNALQPKPQLEIDWNTPDNWTAGTLLSKIDFQDHQSTSLETDFYLIKQAAIEETQVSLGAYYYPHPDHRLTPGSVRYSMFEAIAGASHIWGPFSANVSLAWSPNYSGQTGESASLLGGLAYQATTSLTLSEYIGKQWVADWDRTAGSGYPYTYWDVGAAYTWRNTTMAAHLLGTTLTPAQCEETQGNSDWCGITATLTISYAVL